MAVTEDPGAYKEKLSDYRIVTGNELTTLLTGNRFMMTRTADAWTFLDGGALYDTWCNGNPFLSKYVKWGYGDFQPTWSVQEDKLIITGLNENGNQESASYTVYEYADGIYLLSTDSTAKFVPDQYFTDGSGVYCLYRQIEEDARYLPRA